MNKLSIESIAWNDAIEQKALMERVQSGFAIFFCFACGKTPSYLSFCEPVKSQ